MKKAFLVLVATSALFLSACTTPPNQTQINMIENACMVDAGIRPLVNELLPLANLEQITAITAARGVIDPICANPSGSVASNSLAILSNNIATVESILGQLQARKAGKQ